MKLFHNWLKFLGLISIFLTTYTFDSKTLAQTNNNQASICVEDLPSAIENIINQPKLKRSRWGIEVQTDKGEVLYSKNGHQFFTPASSAKLLTTAAALVTIDGNQRLTTPIFAVGDTPNLLSLRVKGQGDPSISTKSLEQIVHQLQALGVKKIDKLIIDDGYFDSPAINPTWEWLDVHSYFATAVNSTILNQNSVTLTILPQQFQQPVKFYWSDTVAGRQWQVINQGITGEKDIPYDIELDGELGQPILKIRGELAINESPDIWDLAVVNPANYFLESLRFYLSQADISVNRGIVVKEDYQNDLERELFVLSSPTISEIIQEINQQSNNLYAEALAQVLAKQINAKNPIEAINYGLNQLGINPNEYVLIDASGLSRQNLVSPQTLVKTLDLMSTVSSSDTQAFQQSLAVAGISGTLKHRFRHTTVAGKLWGKTGTLTGVGSLSGYLFTDNGFSLMISIIVNNSDLESKPIRQVIDQIIIAISHIKQC